MAVDLAFAATSFAAVFAIVNPLGATSFFVASRRTTRPSSRGA